MKLTKEIKYVLYALAALVLLVIVYYFYKGLTKVEEVKSTNEVVNKANQEIDTAKLTLTNVQLNTIVEKLYKAMSGIGTDLDGVYSAFEMVNTRSDVLAVIGNFGMKDGESLSEWLYGDLSQDEINHVNAILASKNINYQF